MLRTARAHACIVTLLLATACRPRTQPLPATPPDVIGRVVEVRFVLSPARTNALGAPGDYADDRATNVKRLRLRVSGSRFAAPGTQAYVGVDGMTEVVRRDAQARQRPTPELEGAFVRVWFRGIPESATPTEVLAMARLVVIDSIRAGVRH